MTAAPRSKAEFRARFARGEFGNRPRTWEDWPLLRDSDFVGLVTMRHYEPNGPCFYEIAVDDLRAGKLPAGADVLSKYHFNESMPDHLLAIQGNIYLIDNGIQLTYSMVPGLPFRKAVTDPYGRFADGLLAQSLLRVHFAPSDYEDLLWLLAEYPDAKVIEFSTYRVPVGILPHRRTVWWEVRNY